METGQLLRFPQFKISIEGSAAAFYHVQSIGNNWQRHWLAGRTAVYPRQNNSAASPANNFYDFYSFPISGPHLIDYCIV